jgi:hypothetical protein
MKILSAGENAELGKSFILLMTITQNKKQPKYSSVLVGIQKLCYSHTVEYYSAIKMNRTAESYNMD